MKKFYQVKEETKEHKESGPRISLGYKYDKEGLLHDQATYDRIATFSGTLRRSTNGGWINPSYKVNLREQNNDQQDA